MTALVIVIMDSLNISNKSNPSNYVIRPHLFNPSTVETMEQPVTSSGHLFHSTNQNIHDMISEVFMALLAVKGMRWLNLFYDLFNDAVRNLLYRVSQEEMSIFWEVIESVILRKKFYLDTCPIPNGFRYLARNIFLPPSL
jgi:hypothetical protein